MGSAGMSATATSLRAELRDVSCDHSAVARAAAMLFDAPGHEAERRWLDFELTGYGAATTAQRLHEVLGLEEAHPLVQEVAAYRSEVGVRTDQQPEEQVFHFFVESLRELADAGGAVERAATTPFVELAFEVKGYPRTIEFPRDVFHRVLSGFAIALERRLGALP
ncbi:MAG: hypothetical protein HY744_19955 [Deltaproteobacteria bacterium]|nr:hypothetical protein [Deltaproteobacteria bacterium]